MNERLYTDLAPWWPLLSPPEDYAAEAAVYRRMLATAADPLASLLELGSGGGHLASHLDDLARVLVDASDGMLAVSRALNPTVRHARADMRTVRLGRVFDAVLLHDAVMYLTSRADLVAALQTAAAHCRPGGALLVLPDHIVETWEPTTVAGGSDRGDRGARMLEWHDDPDPSDHTTRVEMVYLLREGDRTSCVHETHELGLFDRATWWSLIQDAGFDPVEADPLDAVEVGCAFLARRR